MRQPPPTHNRQPIHTVCPACGRGHDVHREFGAYCTLRCLTAGMEGRIPANTEQPPRFATRSQHHAS